MAQIIDISLPIFDGMPVYPGNIPTKIEQTTSGSGQARSSIITLTSHAGTHLDAPVHFIPGAPGIDSLPLTTFYGPCRVLNMTECRSGIRAKDLEPLDVQCGERILLKTTNSIRGFDEFYEDYVYLETDGAEYLASRDIALIGIDSLSIKQRGGTDNTAHTAFLTKNIPILEGLNLKNAEAKNYRLCAFPLAFKGIDGSPTRAILLSD